MINQSHQCYTGNFQDAIRITQSGVCEGNIIDDESGDMSAHRDAIQLIPNAGYGRSQFAAALLSDVLVKDNRITSNGALQGIFSSDGLLDNITVTGNVIQTKSQHHITLAGLMGGEIHSNTDGEGNPSKVVLMPLRIGGNPGTGNVWVLSFSDPSKYAYRPIIGMDTDSDCVSDLRMEDRSNYANTFLYEFDLDAFRVYAARIDNTVAISHYAKALQDLAKNCGLVS